jgi:hypothetical protein
MQTAFLVPGLTIAMRDERGERRVRRGVLPAQGRLSEFAEYLADG